VPLHPVGVGVNYFTPGERPSTPLVTGTSVQGAPITTAADRGHILVVNIWGSWCAPCRAEASGVADTAQRTEAQGVRFLGIDVEDTKARAREFELKYGVSYPSVFDPSGALRTKFSYPAFATPTTYVLDQHGRIAAVVYGKTTEHALTNLIHKVQATA
jgi:thiol-disulfide isomerase/thioredoxin